MTTVTINMPILVKAVSFTDKSRQSKRKRSFYFEKFDSGCSGVDSRDENRCVKPGDN